MVLEPDDDGAIEVDDDNAWPSDDSDHDDHVANALSLHPRDISNFAKLCSALKIFLSDVLTEADVREGDQLIRQYCIELLEVCVHLRTLAYTCH